MSKSDHDDDPWYAKAFLAVFMVLAGALIAGAAFAWFSSAATAKKLDRAKADSMSAITDRFWLGAAAGGLGTAVWLVANWRK